MRTALDLLDLTLRMYEQRLRRESPSLSEEEIDRRIHDWLCDRPGAPYGDAEGRPIEWPER